MKLKEATHGLSGLPKASQCNQTALFVAPRGPLIVQTCRFDYPQVQYLWEVREWSPTDTKIELYPKLPESQ